MNQVVQALATMIGMLPPTDKNGVATLAYIQAWAKGIVFALAAVAALIAIITAGTWVAQVLAPRLLGA